MASDLIIDINDDPNQSLYKMIQKEVVVPVFVKTASTQEEKQIYALPEMKKFACDTPSDVWISYHYLQKTASNINPSLAKIAKENIVKYASWMQVNLQSEKIPQNIDTVYEINNEDFAVSIPVSNLNSEFLTKSANYVYNDCFVLYPLNNEFNIKKANENFPKGLDGDFEGFRPQVAQAIASKLNYEGLSQNVKDYQPIPFTKVASQLNYRASKFPEYREEYQKAYDDFIDQEEIDFVKYASALEAIDEKIGMSSLYSNDFYSPLRYLAGVKDDRDYSMHKIKFASGNNLFFKDVLAKKASLINDIPDTNESHFKTPVHFENYLKSQPSYLESAIELTINGKQI